MFLPTNYKEKQIFKFTFKGEPKTKSNSYFAGKGKFYVRKANKQYEDSLKRKIKNIAKKKKHEPTSKPVKVVIRYYLGSKRRKDLQNLPKTTCDAMNKIVYEDDSQIVMLVITKHYSKINPRVEVEVSEVW